MRKFYFVGLVVLVGILLISASVSIPGKKVEDIRYPQKIEKTGVKTSANVKIDPDFGKIPLYFIPNKGHVHEKARFYARTSRYTLWMTKQGLVFDSIRQVGVKAEVEEIHLPHSPYSPHSPESLERDVSRVIFLNANTNPEMMPVEMTQHKVNYFIGKDSSKWKKGISTSKAVLYKNIYKNIDLKVYGNERQIEYDWIVRPGGIPGDIRIEYRNVKSAQIDRDGNLVVETRFGKLIHKKPVSYQQLEGNQIGVQSQFRKISNNTYGFAVKAYDKNYELIIDPVVSLKYSTYLGGSNSDAGYGIDIDGAGNIYIAGYTTSIDFPAENSYQNTNAGEEDVIFTKMIPDGSELFFSTYLGGNQNDRAMDIKKFSNGYIYITGYTNSSNFPSSNGVSGKYDAFVARFNISGNYLGAYCVGGSEVEFSYAIAEDKFSNAFITGYTHGADFPTVNPFNNNTTLHHTIAFISKLNSELSTLKYSTYLGGFAFDYGMDITVDDLGFFYVVGYTNADQYDFPLKNAYQSEKQTYNYSAFLCKFRPSGSELDYSTFLEGSNDDYGYWVEVDSSGTAYVMGTTASSDFPTKNAFQSSLSGGYDVFVTRFESDGSDLIFSTFLGGSGNEKNWKGGGAVDKLGRIYILGNTESADFPVKNAFQGSNAGGVDALVCKLSADGSSLIYATYLGGMADDRANGIAIGPSGDVYITGTTFSSDFPTANPYQDFYAGAWGDLYKGDVFVSRLSNTYFIMVQCTTDPGVPISVSPDDINGYGSGNTDFTRTYDPGEVLTLTAPETFNDKIFYKWTIDGQEYFNRKIMVTIDGDITASVKYQTPAEIFLSRTHLCFGASTSGIATNSQTFFISKSGESTLNWSISDNASWLNCNPASGTDAGEVNVSIDASGLSPGTYNGVVTVSDPDAANSPQTIGVILTVYSAAAPGVPFGYFETPHNGAAVMSSIPVTGWALDDIGVECVKIYREENKNLVYVGDAAFVEGARPDVELAYSNYPNCYKAGWGYMMLTNFLPNGGNGTFVIHAISTDKEGNQVTLGTKTVHCDNTNAVKPFGAIDTPSQGGAASGTSFINFGWVLTPQPNYIPTDGSTINVWIDGVNVGNPVYNNYRGDIALLFPGYANSNGAVGYFYIDTTQYENGLHTIQWTAMDSAGNVDGIGSRYFLIRNTGENRKQETFTGQRSRFNVDITKIPVDYSQPVRIKKDVKENIKYKTIYPNHKGITTTRIKELQRVEIHVFGHSSKDGKGFQLVGDRLCPLPIGSTFDPERGVFYWLPGPGFIGMYRLVFVEEKPNRGMRKKFINIEIVPKFKRR